MSASKDPSNIHVPYPDGLPTNRPLDEDSYFTQLHTWLDLEAEAERARLARLRQIRSQRDVEATGQAIVGLQLFDHQTGLGGRFLLDLSKANGSPLPMNRLKVGSPVILSDSEDSNDDGIPGVVSKRNQNVIQIATERFPESKDGGNSNFKGRDSGRSFEKTSPQNASPFGSPSSQRAKAGIGKAGKASKKGKAGSASKRTGLAGTFRLDLSPDETTRLRQRSAMANAQTQRGRPAKMKRVLLGIDPPRFDGQPITPHQPGQTDAAIQEELAEIEFRTELNPPQRRAVAFALMADDVAVIHGPPGTGKTTTLAEVIAQAVSRGDRVLACAASNTAVDNLLERVAALMPNVVRVGHPARVFEGLREHTLDALVENDPTSQVIRDLRKELDETLRNASKMSSSRSSDRYETRRRRGEMFAYAGQLRGQIRSLERSIVRGVLESADVICTTTTIDDDLLGDARFDLVIVDEACQATEPSLWQAVLRADRLILAGDHCQLPPTVLSDEATRIGMRESLMQRLVQCYGIAIFERLVVQYRMHEDIMRFSSNEFYDGELVADVSVRRRRLGDLEHVDSESVEKPPLGMGPLRFIDTAGAEFLEQVEPDGLSKLNPGEANVLVGLVRQLMEAGTQPEEIAIIAPYAAQVRCLRTRLDCPGLQIDTVDGFQGREKDVVLLTMVRSNDEGTIGFLGDRRRMNVAMTRAKRKLVMVGDSATLGGHEFYQRVLAYFEENESYSSVFETEFV